MDWTAAIDRNHETLKRIVALLFAFAKLAELASSKPRPLRFAVFRLLRTAEAIGRDFVSAMAADCGGRIVRPAQASSLDEADDDMRLAHSFRALAEQLGDVMRRGLAPLRSGRRPVRNVTLDLRNLVADHAALARVTVEPRRLDSS